jgi:ubiquinone/menaquinone biosynthesis C-methylase UbiE
MDVEKLKFDDRSFDFVFSYNAFEHFANPELALREMMRVTKVNGYIYLNFAPLYMSPFGLHAYDFITIPYCQFLFSEELFKKFAKLHGLGGGDFLFVNKWSLEDYRRLWDRYSRDLRKVKYYEHYDITYLELIITYASCFKHKTNYFENLVVSNIEVLFKKLI